MAYLMQIHIGPVQDFIAAARRSRDLWFGSWWLSEMSKAAARAVAEAVGGPHALIFPAPADLNELKAGGRLTVSNKIVAVIDSDPQTVAAKAEEALYERLNEMIGDAFDQSTSKALQKQWATLRNQIDDLPEFYWVAVQFSGDNFSAARREADRLLAARKTLRQFAPVSWGGKEPKSSLDGRRESVIPESYVHDADSMYKLFRAKEGERLSGVDLFKRLGKIWDGEEKPFPSTSHMAALLINNQLQEKWSPSTQKLWRRYFDSLGEEVQKQEHVRHSLRLANLGNADGSLLFASRLRDYLEKDQAQKSARLLEKFFKESKIDKPLPYYALLAGDGDYMGEAISHLTTPQANREFTQKLAGFAEDAAVIVEDHQGAVVYAGGDDVLAFLPLHQALTCGRALATHFQELGLAEEGLGRQPTFSAGIAICHHLEPLEDALTLARDAEKEAKQVPGKNAVCVALDKRSGVERRVTGKWTELASRLQTFTAYFLEESIPSRLAYQLREMALGLGGVAAAEADPLIKDVIKIEAGRIIKRKRRAAGKEELAEKEQQMLLDLIDEVSVEGVANELIIAQELARAADLANNVILPAEEHAA